jgi:GNAT superfamily N-acetyltransferase
VPQETAALDYTVRRLQTVTDAEVQDLSHVLIDCVDSGASVSFLSPLGVAEASAFWHRVTEEVMRGERALLIAEDGSGIMGTVQLILDQPENQPHRADLSKMLVHPRARRRGVGAALLGAAESLAREMGKSLLVLDTASDDARRLYARLGWVRVGVIPGYALLPHGGLCDTTYFYRTLNA